MAHAVTRAPKSGGSKPLTMIVEKTHVWPKIGVDRPTDWLMLGSKKATQLDRHFVVADQQASVLADRDQVTVKQPMDCRRKRDPILYNVRPTMPDRHDMCRPGLGAATAVDRR